ncbi:MAG: hypothetical protein Q8P10_00890 [bacterium]|nr:hypothetical protein [bacterium]
MNYFFLVYISFSNQFKVKNDPIVVVYFLSWYNLRIMYTRREVLTMLIPGGWIPEAARRKSLQDLSPAGKTSLLKDAAIVSGIVSGCSLNLTTNVPEQSTREDLCTPALPTVVFETAYNPNVEQQIQTYMGRLPTAIINALGRDRFKIIVVKDKETVLRKYPNSSAHPGAFTDYTNREIVLDNPLNFPHEVAHAVDFSFGFLSTSNNFLIAEAAYAKAGSQEILNLQKRFIDLIAGTDDNETQRVLKDGLQQLNQDLALESKVKDLAVLPNTEARKVIYSNGDLWDYIGHLFVAGFQGYYFPDVEGKFFKQNFPEFYVAFEQFDAKMRTACK